MELAGKVVLITGASRGIGAATARRLAAAGTQLALCGRDRAALDAVVDDCRGVRAIALPGDLRDLDYAAGLPQRAFDALGRLDAVINNAGLLATGPAQDANLAEWDRMLDINFRACVHLTHGALPLLMREPESAVINLCSIAGRETYPGFAIYSATKHAIHAWSKCLFEDVSARGVKVSAIYPGYVDTEMVNDVPGNHANMIRADDVARTIEFVLQFPSTACPTEIVLSRQRPL